MNEVERIVEQLEAAIEGEAWWHGPNVRKVLDGLDARAAAAKPIPGIRSIWELLLHLMGVQTLLFRRLESDATDLTPGEDFPPVPVITDANWNATRRQYFDRERRLRDLVAKYSPAKLERPLITGGASAYTEFHTYLQHKIYHVAQMGVVKKALTATRDGAPSRQSIAAGTGQERMLEAHRDRGLTRDERASAL